MDRESNIELIRILAMFAIVIGHYVTQTNCIDELSGITQYITLLLSQGARIAVGVFLMIGCWFMVDSKFKPSKIIDLYLQLLFYTLSILIILKNIHYPVSFWDALHAVFPFLLFGVWFVSAYIWLMLFSPFLKKILDFEKDTLKKLLILLLWAIPVLSLVYINMDTKLCVFLSFMSYYLGVGYYKKYLYNNIKLNKYVLLFYGACLYLFLASIKYYCIIHGFKGLLYAASNSYLTDYHSLPNLFIAFSVFYYFINTKIKTNKVINYVSTATLTVYIIHQAPGFIDFLWHNIYRCETWVHSDHFLLYLLLVPTSLYILCLILELFRKKVVMFFIKKTTLYNELCKKLDDFYQTAE